MRYRIERGRGVTAANGTKVRLEDSSGMQQRAGDLILALFYALTTPEFPRIPDAGSHGPPEVPLAGEWDGFRFTGKPATGI